MNRLLTLTLVVMVTMTTTMATGRDSDYSDSSSNDDDFEIVLKKVEQLRGELREERETRIRETTQLQRKTEQLESRINQLSTTSTSVAFAAKLRASRNYNFGATIVFDAPIANVGNRYNARNGIFTAAVDGTYFFSVTILSDTNIQVDASLRQNNIEKCAAYARPGVHQTGSCEVVLSLSRGDTVKIAAGPNLAGLRYHARHCFFSGFLISAN